MLAVLLASDDPRTSWFFQHPQILRVVDLYIKSSVTYTELYVGLEHLMTETRLLDERFASLMGVSFGKKKIVVLKD
jgi:hypothetical protein